MSYYLYFKNLDESMKTEDFCLNAVSRDGLVLEFIKYPSEEICPNPSAKTTLKNLKNIIDKKENLRRKVEEL